MYDIHTYILTYVLGCKIVHVSNTYSQFPLEKHVHAGKLCHKT